MSEENSLFAKDYENKFYSSSVFLLFFVSFYPSTFSSLILTIDVPSDILFDVQCFDNDSEENIIKEPKVLAIKIFRSSVALRAGMQLSRFSCDRHGVSSFLYFSRFVRYRFSFSDDKGELSIISARSYKEEERVFDEMKHDS